MSSERRFWYRSMIGTSGNRAIFSYQKGLRRCYALGLISTKEKLIVLPSHTSFPVRVDGGDRRKYRPVCNLRGGVSEVSLALESRKDRNALGIKEKSEAGRAVGGLERYPFTSPFGPALFVLAWGTELWCIEDVAPHMVALSEQVESGDGFTGLERLYLDACRVGLFRELERTVNFSIERRTWLAALAASANGHHGYALGLCKNLPSGRFPERNSLVVVAAQAGFSNSNRVEQLLDATDKSTVAGKVLASIWSGQLINRAELRLGAAEIASWISDSTVRQATLNSFLPIIHDQVADIQSSTSKTGVVAELKARACLQDALEKIFSAQWERALISAKQVLRITNQEDIRDEALNLLACAQWQLGQDERAIDALLHALEGEYNASLQTNIGVVAANLEPQIAAEYLGELSIEAPTTELKYAALIRGVSIWSRGLSEDDESPMPELLSMATRNLAVSSLDSNDLSDEKLWPVLYTLAVHDSVWLKTNLLHRRISTPQKQIVQVALARTEGPIEFVKAVGQLKDNSSPWCAKQRRDLVDLVLRIQSNMPFSQFAIIMGMELLETDIELIPVDGVRLRLHNVLGICKRLDNEGSEPADNIKTIFFEAAAIFTNQCSAQEQLDLRKMLEIAGSGLLASVICARHLQLVEMSKVMSRLISDIKTRPWNISVLTFRDNVDQMLQVCRNSVHVVNQLKPFVGDEKIIESARKFTEDTENVIERLELMTL